MARYDRLVAKNEVKSDELNIRGLTIAMDSRRVYINGNEVTLTTKEFDLLQFLASNPDRVFFQKNTYLKRYGGAWIILVIFPQSLFI